MDERKTSANIRLANVEVQFSAYTYLLNHIDCYRDGEIATFAKPETVSRNAMVNLLK